MAKRLQYPLKRSPASDPQQYRVYRMENETIGGRAYMRMSRVEIRRLVRSISREYRIAAPDVLFADLGRWAAEWRERPSKGKPAIVLNTNKGTSHDLLTITHEMAHHLHYQLAPKECMEQEAHGAEFMACHISILDTFRVVPVIGMRAICDKYKIKYNDPGTTNSLAKLTRCVKKKGS